MASDKAADDFKVSAIQAAKPFREEIAGRIERFYKDNPPKLVGFLANADPAAKMYAEWTGKACRADKIEYELRVVDPMDLEAKLHEANRDPSVHGIMIYYPVFGAETSFDGGSMDDFLRDSISPEKDVEGLCHTYRSNLYRNVRYMDAERTLKCLLPCTPLAVVKILEAQGCYDASLPEGSRLLGKTVTVVNRSEIVGRPLAALLANDGATVYSIDIDSVYKVGRGAKCTKCDALDTEKACAQSQVVVLGVPVKSYKLPTSCIMPGTLVVNVASCRNVEEEDLKKIPGTKFCSAVGKVTVSLLERNLLRLYENFHRHGSAPEPTGLGPRTTSQQSLLAEPQAQSSKAASDSSATHKPGESPGGGSADDLKAELGAVVSVVYWSAVVCVACTLVSSATVVWMASGR